MDVKPSELARILKVVPETVLVRIRKGELTAKKRSGTGGYLLNLRQALAEWFGRDPDQLTDVELDVLTSGRFSGRTTNDLGAHYDGESLDTSQAIEKFWKAKKAELEFRKSSGELIEVSEIQKIYADEVTACRTKLLAIPSRAKQRLGLTDEQFTTLDSLVRESLEELGRESQADDDNDSEEEERTGT